MALVNATDPLTHNLRIRAKKKLRRNLKVYSHFVPLKRPSHGITAIVLA